MNTSLDLILHPIRLRILVALSGQQLTPRQLATRLPDVAQATLYRQINSLVKGELIQVVAEKQIRGTVEKLYDLVQPDLLKLTQDDIAQATPEDHARFFSIYLTTLMGEFSRYLNRPSELNLAKDGVGYHIEPLYMTREEVDEWGQGMQDLLAPYKDPQAGREQRLFSFTIFPADRADREEKDS